MGKRKANVQRTCELPGCSSRHYAKGMCRFHYYKDWSANRRQVSGSAGTAASKVDAKVAAIRAAAKLTSEAATKAASESAVKATSEAATKAASESAAKATSEAAEKVASEAAEKTTSEAPEKVTSEAPEKVASEAPELDSASNEPVSIESSSIEVSERSIDSYARERKES